MLISATALLLQIILTGPAAAMLDKSQVQATVEKTYDAKVLRVYEGEDNGRSVFFVRVMYNGGNYNTAFQVNTLVIDADTGKRISQFRHEPSGRSLSGNYDSRPNRQSPSALRRGHIWR